MSYDYDALVSEISTARKLAQDTKAELKALEGKDGVEAKELEYLEHLSTATDKFETLSKHCPMTPLLWMQYALDNSELMLVLKKQETTDEAQRPQKDETAAMKAASSLQEALETRIQFLEFGLKEFPGSAILRLHHAELMCVLGLLTQAMGTSFDWKIYRQALDDAISIIGHGSHRNESKMVVMLYQMKLDLETEMINPPSMPTSSSALAKVASNIYLQRAATPMNDDINASLIQEFASSKWSNPTTLSRIEDKRRWEAKHFGFLITFEDDIDAALLQESGVSNKDRIDRFQDPYEQFFTFIDDESRDLPLFVNRIEQWNTIINGDNGGCWMGLGGPHTARAFVQYAKACFRYRTRRKNDEETSESRNLEREIQSLAISVFERGVAECPTVDSLWLSYLRRLTYLIDQEMSKPASAEGSQELNSLLTTASKVVDRAIRNCPYSVPLVKERLNLTLAMANANMLILDPEDLLTKFLINVLDSRFIQPSENANPAVAVDLFRALLDIVRRRILVILANIAQTRATNKQGKKEETASTRILGYDDAQSIQPVLSPDPINDTNDANKYNDEDLRQDLEDLCNDLREIYTEADAYFAKNQKRYNTNSGSSVTIGEARAALFKDRAVIESYLISPLLFVLETIGNGCHLEGDDEGLAKFLKQHVDAVNKGQPPHPGTYLEYIKAFSSSTTVVSSMITSPSDILTNLRRIRFLYQEALKRVGTSKPKTNANPLHAKSILFPDELDYETSLRCLCRDYLLFERRFGSEKSYSECQKAVQKKLAKAFAMNPSNINVQNTSSSSAAAATINVDASHDATEASVPMALEANTEGGTTSTQKRLREDGSRDGHEPSAKRTKKPTNFQELNEQQGGKKQYPKNKVKVGKLEYPAHPFTVKVSFLSPQTEDMDLVDALRPKCGPIVHAKIMRDKHSGKSKGWALVQFEEHESVTTALSLSQVLGIKGKTATIERSHQPAIGLVPPGMHRVNPKGEGKSTKRNQLKKNNKKKGNEGKDGKAKNPKPPLDAESNKPAASKPSSTSTSSIFAFRPRGVSGGSQQRKAKISIASEGTKK